MTERTDRVIQTVIKIAKDKNGTPSQIAMAWCLAQPGITSVITGADSVERVTENCATSQIVLTEDELAQLEQVSEGQRLIIHKDAPDGYDG